MEACAGHNTTQQTDPATEIENRPIECPLLSAVLPCVSDLTNKVCDTKVEPRRDVQLRLESKINVSYIHCAHTNSIGGEELNSSNHIHTLRAKESPNRQPPSAINNMTLITRSLTVPLFSVQLLLILSIYFTVRGYATNIISHILDCLGTTCSSRVQLIYTQMYFS